MVPSGYGDGALQINGTPVPIIRTPHKAWSLSATFAKEEVGHERGESDPMLACQTTGQLLTVPCQSAAPGCPREGSLHHPSAHYQYECSLGLMALHDLQPESLLRGIDRWPFPRATLIHLGKLDLLTSSHRDGLHQLLHWLSILLIKC